MSRDRIRMPSLKPAQRQRAAMEKASAAVFALARIMPHHAGPNQEFTRFMVNLQAELRRAGYLATGDGKGGFLPSPADLAAARQVCPKCKTGWIENNRGRCECDGPPYVNFSDQIECAAAESVAEIINWGGEASREDD